MQTAAALGDSSPGCQGGKSTGPTSWAAAAGLQELAEVVLAKEAGDDASDGSGVTIYDVDVAGMEDGITMGIKDLHWKFGSECLMGLPRKDYEEKKELVANEITRRLEKKLFPGLQDSIVLKETLMDIEPIDQLINGTLISVEKVAQKLKRRAIS